jgi:hypothetical protein
VSSVWGGGGVSSEGPTMARTSSIANLMSSWDKFVSKRILRRASQISVLC